MIKKVSILTFLLWGIAVISFAQSAQATMRVSVRVVSGSSVTMNQPSNVILKNNQAASLGVITLKGIGTENVLISNSSKVNLRDGKGHEMVLNISSKKSIDKDQETISYEGTSLQQGLVSSVYTGQLTTTIEYL